MRNGKMAFDKKIRLRIALWWCVIVLLLAWMVFVGETGGDSRMMTGWQNGWAESCTSAE